MSGLCCSSVTGSVDDIYRREKGELHGRFTLFVMSCVSYSAAALDVSREVFYALGRLPWLAFFLRRSLRLRPRLLIAALLYLIGGSGRAVHVQSFYRAGPRAGGHDAIGR